MRDLIDRTVQGMGYEAIDVEFAASGLLRVFIDRLAPDGGEPASITIEDCERVSHQLGHVFTVEEVDYERLEVSSPGLDRPLITAAHFRRFAGEQVRIKLRQTFRGRRQYTGLLTLEEDGRYGLELTEAIDPGAGGPRRQLPRVGKKQGPRPNKADVRPTGEKLVFSLDELDSARLVPRIDFRRQA
ncbi:MAG: ribosome maturation factor RimP [Burkholderiaceae bacterium]